MTSFNLPMRRILNCFESSPGECLDLSTLLQAGAEWAAQESQEALKERLEAIAELIERGLLIPAGDDRYALTAEGRRLLEG